MNFFVLDTSLQGVTLGLVKITGPSYTIVDVYGSASPQEAAARLPELCQTLLKNQKLSLSDIDGLLVSHGPGSFTGIKIGLSFASGWSRAGTKAKVYGLSSLQGLARQLAPGRSLVLPATQTAGYFATRTALSVEIGVLDLALPGVTAKLNDITSAPIGFPAKELGNVEILGNWPKVEAWLTEQMIPCAKHSLDDFHIRVVGGMVEDFIANSDKLSEGVLVPVYLRKSAPEEKLDNLAKAPKQD